MAPSFFALSLLAASIAATTPSTEVGVAVPMRDGTVLRADVYRAPGATPGPVLLCRTPYGRRHHAGSDLVASAVKRGYVVVVQDVRGRYDSAGAFDPYRNEGRDGFDTIEWAARQPWSDGRVGSFGISYPGAVQWLAAVEAPPHLQAMAPVMTFSHPENFFYAGGVLDLSWLPWIWNSIAPASRARAGLAGPRSDDEASREWARVQADLYRRLPLSALDELRLVAPFFFEWLEHPPGDPWWDFAELRDRYGRVTAAVLNLSGWHDEAYGPEGAVTNHAGLVAARGEGNARSRLVLGPWAHGTPPRGGGLVGARDMGPEAAFDYNETLLRFMDHHLRGHANGEEREPAVRVFVMGEGRWLSGDRWPLPGTRLFELHLAAGTPGRLAQTADAKGEATSSIASDPLHPVMDPHAGEAGARDYRALATDPGVAVFETEPFATELRVVGAIEAELHVSVDAPDADVWVRLFDVAPEGTAWNLMSPGADVTRASYREGGPERKLLAPGEIVVLHWRRLYTGNLFRRGHRLRLVVAPSFFPAFSRNLQTGELETHTSASRTATITLHHSTEHDSKLFLPVVPD